MKSFSKKNYSGEVFILELPNYKLPSRKNALPDSPNIPINRSNKTADLAI